MIHHEKSGERGVFLPSLMIILIYIHGGKEKRERKRKRNKQLTQNFMCSYPLSWVSDKHLPN
jgi:hypothetical protein